MKPIDQTYLAMRVRTVNCASYRKPHVFLSLNYCVFVPIQRVALMAARRASALYLNTQTTFLPRVVWWVTACLSAAFLCHIPALPF